MRSGGCSERPIRTGKYLCERYYTTAAYGSSENIRNRSVKLTPVKEISYSIKSFSG